MTRFSNLEKQAICPHTYRSKEVIFGQKTGDSVCNECGEIFMSNERVAPPEFRNSMITSAHALMIALRVNGKLKLTQNYRTKLGDVCRWALVDETSDFSLPVHSEIANLAISAGQITL
jgi:hypothetical protein